MEQWLGRLAEKAVEGLIVRDRNSLSVDYRGTPVERQLLLLQQRRQNPRSDPDRQHKGHLAVAKDRHRDRHDLPAQHRPDDQIGNLRFARFDNATDQPAGIAWQSLPEPLVGVYELLPSRIVQDERGPRNIESGPQVTIKADEVVRRQARRQCQHLKLGFHAADLPIDRSEQRLRSFLDIALDLLPPVVDSAQNGEARQPDQRQRGRQDQQR